jgi:hypothetical protein
MSDTRSIAPVERAGARRNWRGVMRTVEGRVSEAVIENPVINSAFVEPQKHYKFDDGITSEIVVGAWRGRGRPGITRTTRRQEPAQGWRQRRRNE